MGFPTSSRGLAAVLLSLVCLSSATAITNTTSAVAGKTFDYVIAGAGLSGIILGNKLSAAGYSVAIIEAGPDLPNEEGIYNAALRTTGTECDWQYTGSEVDGSPLATGILISSGRCVGGGTSINGEVWFRPAPGELNLFQSIGNQGWNASTLTPYMTAAETAIAPTALQTSEGAGLVRGVHGFAGPVNTSFPTPMRIPTAVAIYKAAVKLVFGITPSADLSDRSSALAVCASTMWTIWYDAKAQINRRSSAAYAFLYPASQQRATLTVLTGHTVSNVVWSGTKATGLQFAPSSSVALSTVKVSKEVILSAGTLATPPILERSGVGSTAVLKALGIKQVANVPGVGLNLQDQPGTEIVGTIKSANASNPLLVDSVNIFAPVITLPSIDQLFGTAAAAQKTALQQGVAAKATALVKAGAAANYNGAVTLLNAITNQIINGMPIAEHVGESYTGVMAAIFWPSQPLSRGYIHINSTSAFSRPVITPRFLTDDFDLATAVAIAKQSQAMFESSAFAGVIDDANVSLSEDATDEEWEAYVTSTSYGVSHWLGTSAMMPLAQGGVVSNSLNVYGTTNLRVVDASIIPFSLTCHTMPVAYAIALRAADLILGKTIN